MALVVGDIAYHSHIADPTTVLLVVSGGAVILRGAALVLVARVLTELTILRLLTHSMAFRQTGRDRDRQMSEMLLEEASRLAP